MDGSGGHFDKGRWVEDEKPSPADPINMEYNEIEKRLKSAAAQVGRGIDELIEAGKDLIGSQEGKQLLGKKLDQITGDIIHSFEDIRREGTDLLNQAMGRLFK
jgi:hypothetical protein